MAVVEAVIRCVDSNGVVRLPEGRPCSVSNNFAFFVKAARVAVAHKALYNRTGLNYVIKQEILLFRKHIPARSGSPSGTQISLSSSL
jgi:hypothetical protein